MNLPLIAFVFALLGNRPQSVHADGTPNPPVIGQRVEIFTCHFEIAPGVIRDCTPQEWQIGYAAWLRRYGTNDNARRSRSSRRAEYETEARRDRDEFERDMHEADDDIADADAETNAVDNAWRRSPRRHRRHR